MVKTSAQKMKCLSLIIFVLYLAFGHGANILCLMGVPSPSHHIWNRALMEGIAAKGHNLTIISPDIEKNQPANINYIHLESIYPALYDGADGKDLMDMTHDTTIDSLFTFTDLCVRACNGASKSKGMEAILNYPDDFKFDLVLHDCLCGPCLLGLLHKFKHPPLISITPFNNPPFTPDMVGGQRNYAYSPHYVLSYNANMSFWERIHNTFIHLLDAYIRDYQAVPAVDKIMRERYNFENMPNLHDMEQESLLLLANSDPALDVPVPLPPNHIPVGGLQIKTPKPLPNDINSFMESAKKGVVLFSLGTNVRSDMIGKERQQMFIDAFKRIPQYNFLWKFETNLDLDLPANVMIKPFLPQNDILGHPKTKAFITHGGLLSSQEASWYGVPMIGIPFFMDQYRNVHKLVASGVGDRLDIHSLSTEKIRSTLLRVLETPKYKTNMKIRSTLFRDQPEKPLDRAVWWVEWALRHPRTTHLKSPQIALGTFRTNLWDIWMFFAAVAVIIAYSIRKLLRVFSKGATTSESKKKN